MPVTRLFCRVISNRWVILSIQIYIKVSVKHVCSMRVNFGKFLIFHLLCEVRKLWDYPDVFNVLCFLSRSKLAIFSHIDCNEVTLSEMELSLELWSIIAKWHRGGFENFISTPKTSHNYRIYIHEFLYIYKFTNEFLLLELNS